MCRCKLATLLCYIEFQLIIIHGAIQVSEQLQHNLPSLQKLTTGLLHNMINILTL